MTTDDNKVQQETTETQPFPSDDEPTTVEVVARFLKVSTRTVQRYVDEKALPCRRMGGVLRFYLGEVRTWLDAQ